MHVLLVKVLCSPAVDCVLVLSVHTTAALRTQYLKATASSRVLMRALSSQLERLLNEFSALPLAALSSAGASYGADEHLAKEYDSHLRMLEKLSIILQKLSKIRFILYANISKLSLLDSSLLRHSLDLLILKSNSKSF